MPNDKRFTYCTVTNRAGTLLVELQATLLPRKGDRLTLEDEEGKAHATVVSSVEWHAYARGTTELPELAATVYVKPLRPKKRMIR